MMKLKLIIITAVVLAMTAGFNSCKKDDKKYVVTFDSGEGTSVQSQTVEAGGVATAPANPEKEGYVFLFWHLSESTTAYDFQTPVNSDITLVAKWEEEEDAVYLLTELSYSDRTGSKMTIYLYDEQNRITKITEYDNDGIEDKIMTLNYDGADLISMKTKRFGGEYTHTYTKDGSKIVITASNTSGITTIDLNAQGFPLKATLKTTVWSNVLNCISPYTWQNGNITQADYKEEYESGPSTDYYISTTFTYDDNKSPFYNCQTPAWWIIREGGWWINNNPIISVELYNEIVTETKYTYTYNDDGFPLTIEFTVISDDEIINEGSYTFKYDKK